MSVIDNDRFRKLLRAYPASAIEHLFEVYYKTLFRIALRLTRDPDAAADVVQDTFMVVWTRRKELSKDHELPIERFLLRVVRNKSISCFTRNSKHLSLENLLELSSQPFETDGMTIEKSIIEAEISQQVRLVISTFPTKERECLLMLIDERMAIDEIAERQSVTRGAVERSLTSARKRLRKWALKNPR